MPRPWWRGGQVVALATLVVPLLAAAVLAFQEGGYFVTSWGVASIVLWAALVARLVVAPAGHAGWAGLAAAVALVVLAVWQGASSSWALEPSSAVAAMNLTLLYAAALALGMVAGRGRVPLVAAVSGALLVVVVVAIDGVGARLFPDVIGGDRLPRLNTPISYWNAQGALFAFGIVCAIGLAGTASLPRWVRVPALASVPLLALGLYLTLSRGGMALLGLALLALVLLAPDRLETVLVAALAALAAAPAVVLAARNDLTSLGSEPLPTGSGSRHDVALALIAGVVAVAVAGWLVTVAAPRVGERPPRTAGIALIAVTAVALVGGYAVAGPGNPVSWADRQFDSFRSYGTGERNDSSVSSQLATAAGTGRWQNWGVALDEWRDAPLAGTGAGDYRFWWNQQRPIPLYVVNAHSLYLETLGESGLVGLVLLLVPLGLGLVLIAAVLVRRGPPALRRDLAVAGAAVSVIALHAAGDWDWQLPAVMIPGLVVGGAALAAAADGLGFARSLTWPAALVAGVVGVVATLLVAGPITSQQRVDEAKAAARDGRLERALELAREGAERDGGAPGPRLVEAYVLTDLGRAKAADVAFRAALARSPRDWSIMADWAGSLIARGQYDAAGRLARRAKQLNPREARVVALGRVLAARRARIAPAVPRGVSP